MSVARVLFVEDETVARELIRVQLKSCDFFPLFAEDGNSCLEALKEEEISLLIMDYQLPDISGLSLVRIVKEMKPGLPVVVLSAQPDPVIREAVLEAGAELFLPKPFNMSKIKEQLEQLVGTALSRKSLTAERNSQAGKLFLEVVPGYFEELQKAVAAEDARVASRLVHKLKGALSVCSEPGLLVLIKKIEEVISSSMPHKKLVNALGEKLDEYYAILKGAGG